MATPTLPRNSYLLVFPEDLEGTTNSPRYVKIKSSRGTMVTATVESDEDDNGMTVKIPRSTALVRVVVASDATGSRLGTWLRKAVCVMSDNQFQYGQVTGYSPAGLVVATVNGPIEVSSDDIRDEVSPVVAMTMCCHNYPVSSWNYSRLEQIHDALMERLLEPAPSPVIPQAPSIADLTRGLIPTVSPAYDRIMTWTNPNTGTRSRISLQHVINHVFYVDGAKPIPQNLEGCFGSSFCDVPSPSTNNPVGRQRPTTTSSQATLGPENTSSFFDETAVDDDVEEAAEAATIARSLLTEAHTAQPDDIRATVIRPHVQPTEAAVPPAATTTPPRLSQESPEESEIIDLIRAHKPHLLPYHLGMQTSASSRLPLKRTGERRDDSSAFKRSKFSFSPTSEQQHVHNLITAERFRGKSPAAFVESLVSSKEIQMWAYPGVSTRAFDFQFGTRGLSFLHFAPIDQLVRLQRQRENFINTSDFSISAKFLAAPEPSTWEELLTAANGFQQYCYGMCDSVTQQLAMTMYNFVGTMRNRNLWPQDQLPMLVLWIDAQLENYRNAVAADAADRTITRNGISSFFRPDNIELHGILITAQRDRLERIDRAQSNSAPKHDQTVRQTKHQRQSSSYGRKVPDDTVSLIPRHEGKEVCLKFLSKKGCPSSDSSVCVYASRVHFFPAALPEKLRGYLRRKFGGVNAHYANN